MPELPGRDDGVEPEGEHHDDNDDLLGRNVAQVCRVRHQGPVQTDHRAIRRHPGMMLRFNLKDQYKIRYHHSFTLTERK